ncbi:redoxin domain-containing protein [Fictibacillus aquaticus]|nr:TlpA disulfide reductase family protein [Fictibacillus aquaticus]
METFVMIAGFPIKSDWLFILAGGIAAYILLLLKYRTDNKRKELLDIVANAVITGFAVWKFSYVLFHPAAALKSPINILYFNGAETGIVLGVIAAVVYALRAAKKNELNFESLFFGAGYGASGFFAVYFALRYFLAGHKLEEGFLSFLMFTAVILLSIQKANNIRNVSFTLIGIGLAFSVFNATPFANKKEQREAAVATSAATGIKQGNKAPDFELDTLSNGKMKLSDQKGKVVFINIWASWCPPCRAEMPEMESFYQKYGGKRAEILAVNLTDSDSRKAAKEFADKNKLTFPILLDSSGQVGSTYQAVTIPTTYIIDQDGVIVNKHIGPMDFGTMEKYMENAEK